MKRLRLPYLKEMNLFLLIFFCVPLGIYLKDYFIDHKHIQESMLGIKVFIIPAILTLIFHLPFFSFKEQRTITSSEVLLRIPVGSFLAYLIFLVLAFTTFAHIFIFIGGEKTHISVLTFSCIATLLSLLAWNSDRVIFANSLTNDQLNDIIAKKKADIGLYTYSEEGFTYADSKHPFQCKWSDIESIVAYKSDTYTFDTIHLQLTLTNGMAWNTNEDVPGWFIFTDKMETALTGIDKYWQIKTMGMPFEVNATLVYKRATDY